MKATTVCWTNTGYKQVDVRFNKFLVIGMDVERIKAALKLPLNVVQKWHSHQGMYIDITRVGENDFLLNFYKTTGVQLQFPQRAINWIKKS